MTCPHSAPTSEKATVCGLLSTIRGGESKVSILKVCQSCQHEWTDGPPTCDNLTPTLQRLTPSRGFGDTLSKVFHATGIDRVAKAVLGKDCGCPERQKRLNELLPYKEQSNG